MWSNDVKYKYMFILPLKNLARKKLIIAYDVDGSTDNNLQ